MIMLFSLLYGVVFHGQIEHYLQIVKTEVVKSNGHTMIEEYEYTAHSSIAHSYYLPVAKFHFDLSPMQVSFNIFFFAAYSYLLHGLGMLQWVENPRAGTGSDLFSFQAYRGQAAD